MKTSLPRLKALADPTRLRILGLLQEEELSVGELTSILGMAQSRVSGHLGVLRETHFVQDRRQGTSVFYTLAPGDTLAPWKALVSADPTLGLPESDRRRLVAVRKHRRERGREFFDRVAETWDTGRSESLGIHAGGLALAGLLSPDALVLDLGTGTGSLLPLLGRHLRRVVAVDGSRGMLARARGRVRAAGAGSVRLVRADVGSLPFPDGAADGVVANMILHHLPEPESLFEEIARVLRPGGRGVVVDFAAHEAGWLLEEEGHRWPGFPPHSVRAWCRRAGLMSPCFESAPIPRSGRWAALDVFVARFERPAEGPRIHRTAPRRARPGKKSKEN